MSPPQRIAHRTASILELNDREGTASLEVLAALLEASTMTVRAELPLHASHAH